MIPLGVATVASAVGFNSHWKGQGQTRVIGPVTLNPVEELNSAGSETALVVNPLAAPQSRQDQDQTGSFDPNDPEPSGGRDQEPLRPLHLRQEDAKDGKLPSVPAPWRSARIRIKMGSFDPVILNPTET